jgi:hypothetical protein
MEKFNLTEIPEICPFCGSDGIENYEEFYDDEASIMSQVVICHECDQKWELHYLFENWIPV